MKYIEHSITPNENFEPLYDNIYFALITTNMKENNYSNFFKKIFLLISKNDEVRKYTKMNRKCNAFYFFLAYVRGPAVTLFYAKL